MSERNGYQPGVRCWGAAVEPGNVAAVVCGDLLE